jgi:hypothetical protein
MTGERLKVIVCDNDEDRAQGWCESIAALAPEQLDVEALSPGDFSRAVQALTKRVRAAKAGKSHGDDAAVRFDSADVLVVDSDLTPDPEEEINDVSIEEILVGEVGDTVARLARAHSGVGAIVMVNEAVKQRTFDLTLSRWSDGVADVYITENDIANPALWGYGVSSDGYRPWSWTTLNTASRLLPEVASGWNLDTRVFDVVGLPSDDVARLLSRQIESLVDDTDDVETITLGQVAQSRTYGLGRQPKEDADPEQLLRVAVWGVRRWFARVIVAPQDVVIDLPHLLQERPYLIPGRNDPVSWNREAPSWWAGAPSLILADAQNSPASVLLGRPMWNVSALPRPERGEEPTADDPVFCEDTSRLVSADGASSFDSDLPGVFSSRWVERLDSAAYTPRQRLFR